MNLLQSSGALKGGQGNPQHFGALVRENPRRVYIYIPTYGRRVRAFYSVQKEHEAPKQTVEIGSCGMVLATLTSPSTMVHKG